ncbi:MAG: cell division protein SepF [Nitrososphaeria archaeon]
MSSELINKGKQEGVKMILKAYPLKSLSEIEKVKEDLENNTIVILRITPLAQKNIDELKEAVSKLYEIATSSGGDIARLGEDRIILTPPSVYIWRG